MASIQFEGLKTHKIVHERLLEKVVGFQNDLQKSENGRLPEAFFVILKTWLVTHIKEIDIKYGS